MKWLNKYIYIYPNIVIKIGLNNKIGIPWIHVAICAANKQQTKSLVDHQDPPCARKSILDGDKTR